MQSLYLGSLAFFYFHLVKGRPIKWYPDNQSVSRIVEVGSMKEDLQCFTLRDFSVCLLNNIKLEVEWILRSANDGADILSRIVDYDDSWQVERDYFLMVEAKWSPQSVDLLANHENAQLPRFYNTFWCPGSEGVDTFSVP